MTNYEYLTKRLDGIGVNDSDIELLLLRGELDGNDPVNIDHCERVLYKYFSIVIKTLVEKVTEGGYSMERSMKALDAFYQRLSKELFGRF